MNDNTFAQVNTEISIHESSFLSPAYELLLRALSSESRSAALEGTDIIRIMNN